MMARSSRHEQRFDIFMRVRFFVSPVSPPRSPNALGSPQTHPSASRDAFNQCGGGARLSTEAAHWLDLFFYHSKFLAPLTITCSAAQRRPSLTVGPCTFVPCIGLSSFSMFRVGVQQGFRVGYVLTIVGLPALAGCRCLAIGCNGHVLLFDK